MLKEDIYEKLVFFTDEEIDHLNGKLTVDKSIFFNEHSNIIDCNKLLTKTQQISVRKHARFMEYPRHKHNYIELMYVYSGQMTHHFDDQKLTIYEGEILLLNQNIEHSIEYCNENDIIFNFIIKAEFLEFLSHMVEMENDIIHFIFDALYSFNNNGEYLVFKVSDNPSILQYTESIITHLYEPQINTSLELKLLVGLLLAELMNHPESIESYQSNSYEKLLFGSIIKYITTQFKEGSLQALCEQIHQPDYKVCRMLKKQTGKTFKQLIQAERLKVATQLLITTQMPVVEVMNQIGYENITYFYKIFKQTYGMTPHAYRIFYVSAK